jgi:hypothetical protein
MNKLYLTLPFLFSTPAFAATLTCDGELAGAPAHFSVHALTGDKVHISLSIKGLPPQEGDAHVIQQGYELAVPNGRLTVWTQPEDGRRYYISYLATNGESLRKGGGMFTCSYSLN